MTLVECRLRTGYIVPRFAAEGGGVSGFDVHSLGHPGKGVAVLLVRDEPSSGGNGGFVCRMRRLGIAPAQGRGY